MYVQKFFKIKFPAMSQDRNKGNGEPSMYKNRVDVHKLNSSQPGKPMVGEQFSTACRICHSAISTEKLISPCLCKGSLAFVHLSCLERWLNQSGRDTCELCTFRFEAEQTRRYSICQGLRIWYRHPRHMSQLRADLVIGLVLTGVTLGLCSICVGGMKYFVLEGFRVGISYLWTEGVISFFLTVIILGYFTTIYLMMRDHIVPWYQWWNRCVNVRLILDMDLIPCIEPGSVMANPSTETLMNVVPMKPDPEPEELERERILLQTQKANTIIYLPEISSSSFTRQQVRTPETQSNQMSSLMSAVMSHIIHNSVESSHFRAQQRISKDSTNIDENPKICEEDSKILMGAIGSANAAVSLPELPEERSIEITQPSNMTSPDI